VDIVLIKEVNNVIVVDVLDLERTKTKNAPIHIARAKTANVAKIALVVVLKTMTNK
jgi:hypothetical protein